MKFIKILKFDLKQGIGKNYALFLCPLFIALPAVFDAIHKIKNYIKIEGNETADYSMGDVFMALYGGMEKYVFSPDNPFNFPVIWSVLILVGAFLVLNYPMKDMFGAGSQYLVQGGSRKLWWLSKIIWNIMTTMIFHMIIFAVICAGCILYDIPMRFNININLIEILFEFKQPVDMYYVNSIPATVIFLPVLAAICMNLMQMSVSLFLNPVYSYLLNAMLAVSSAFIMKVFLIYNYAMPLRYKWIFTGGFVHIRGYYVLPVLTIVFITLGMVRFSKYDIIRKGEDTIGD